MASLREKSRATSVSVRKRVLVTDGEQRAALAVVRSLGRAGYEVFVCSPRAKSISGASRYCTESRQVADPLGDPRNFLSDVSRLAEEWRVDVMLPITEAALLAILPHVTRFKCAIPFPSASAFESICDKSIVLKAAAAHGIAVPAQLVLDAPPRTDSLELKLPFPIVAKPSRSVAGQEGYRVRTGVSYAGSEGELLRALRQIPRNAYPVLLQQQIVGPGFGVSVLVWDGRLVASFAHRRIREKPPSGGVSVLRESIPMDAGLLARSVDLLREFDWRGVAMVEYKVESASGRPYLMEINGRPWGSLQLAIDAGVDFPRLLVELALGGSPEAVAEYRTGVRSRWEWGDVDHLLASIRHASRFARYSDSPRYTRLAAILGFVRGFGPANRSEVFRWEDPGPIARETIDWFSRR